MATAAAQAAKPAAKSDAKPEQRPAMDLKLEDAKDAELTPGQNRYRVEMRHVDMDGAEAIVIANSEDAARGMADTASPDGATIERCVLLEVGPTEEVYKAAQEAKAAKAKAAKAAPKDDDDDDKAKPAARPAAPSTQRK